MSKSNIIVKENGDFEVVLNEGETGDSVDMTMEEGLELCEEMVRNFYSYYGEDNQ